jgi:hypothetical protein
MACLDLRVAEEAQQVLVEAAWLLQVGQVAGAVEHHETYG